MCRGRASKRAGRVKVGVQHVMQTNEEKLSPWSLVYINKTFTQLTVSKMHGYNCYNMFAWMEILSPVKAKYIICLKVVSRDGNGQR